MALKLSWFCVDRRARIFEIMSPSNSVASDINFSEANMTTPDSSEHDGLDGLMWFLRITDEMPCKGAA